ncbi:DUF998 domain-containing protein [Candidatus Bathyarchaeota archaeon]|nr:DUF998 domain-containing protein [Candidatus Bathyarchaeota archaeon]
MNCDNRKIAGLLLFVSVVQFVFAKVVCQTIYPGYSVGQQTISDLGNWGLIGNFAAVFAVSAVLMGVFIVAGAYLIRRTFKNRLFTSLLIMAGVSNVVVGVVAEDVIPSVHSLFALIMFVSWAVVAILSYKFVKSPFSFVSVILGAMSLLVLVLSLLGEHVSSSFVLGLGRGGVERLIVYPLWLWTLGLGAYLIGESNDTPITRET